MASASEIQSSSKPLVWTGRVMTTLVAMFMLLDGVMKLIQPTFVLEGTKQLGYPESCLIGLGIVLTASTLLYLIPRTSVLGAILLTGYLGGAVASHVRLSEGWFPTLFPVAFGALAWGGIVLRDPRLRALLPLRS